jgi:glucose-6-phosphate dehydrogenase assembly protein OpcA
MNVGPWSAVADDATSGEAALRSLRRRQPGGARRTAVLSLVVHAESDDDLAAVLDTVRGLAGHSPCRTVVVVLPAAGAVHGNGGNGAGNGSGEGDVAVALRAVGHPGGAVSFVEDIVLRVRGAAVDHLEATVAPWLLPGLPVVAWTPTSLPRRDGPLVALADRVVVDSERLVGPPGPVGLADVLALARRVPVTDLTWVRLEPWRELFARLFVGADFAPFVRRVETVESEGRDLLPSRLLAGWLASRLGLDPAVVRVSGGPRPALRASARHGGRRARFRVERVADGEMVLAGATIDGGPGRGRTLRLPSRPAAHVLAEALTAGSRPDGVWESAAAAALGLRPD